MTTARNKIKREYEAARQGLAPKCETCGGSGYRTIQEAHDRWRSVRCDRCNSGMTLRVVTVKAEPFRDPDFQQPTLEAEAQP